MNTLTLPPMIKAAARVATAALLAMAAAAASDTALAAPPAAPHSPVAPASAPLPYDERADAQQQVRDALAEARRSGRPVLVVFGANWCPDCRALDRAMHTPGNQPLFERSFEVVKVDVGRFDRNLAIAEVYGNPIGKGIPAAVVLSPSNEVLYATRAGELANAREMSETGVYDFFKAAADRAHARH